MIKFCIIVSVLFCSFLGSFAQNADSILIKKIADEVMVNGQAFDNLRYLCKEIGPRLSGSDNAEKAVVAVAEMLKRAGADTVYLQPCMVPHWIRGKKETGYVQLADGTRKELNLCALGNSMGSGKSGVKGQVVEVRSFDELKRLGEAVIKGNIVFYNFPMNQTYIGTFRAYGESGSSRRMGPTEAARYGAIGAMIRSLSSSLDDFPHTGFTGYNDSFPKIPAVAISTNDAEWLSNELRKKMEVTAYFRTLCEMLPDVPSYNVIGEIRGSQFRNEIITVGGHLDSWDLGEGAQDDGAGVVQSIEIIRALNAVEIRPKRTIRAVAFMNEESGGRGSKAYLESAIQKKEHHIFALESDGGGFSPRGFGLDMKQDQVDKVIQWKNLFYPYGVYDFSGRGSGSDVGPLGKLGTALAGLSPDSQRYFTLHHAANDNFESVNKRELHLGSVNMAAFVWLVSEYGL